MQRLCELVASVRLAHPSDHFFNALDETLRTSRHARAQYRAYERAFSAIDASSWLELKRKAVKHFPDHRDGQLKQGFFNQLNDAFAYQHLLRKGHSHVRVLRETGNTCPDLSYRDAGVQKFCEVKSLGISEQEIQRRDQSGILHMSSYSHLPEGFLRKLDTALTKAGDQIASQDAGGLVFIVVACDDFTLTHYRTYRAQIMRRILSHAVAEVVVKVGLAGTRRITKPKLKPE